MLVLKRLCLRYGNVRDVCLKNKRLINEPSHEIMALLVLRKLILQTRMRSHPVGLDV